MEKENIIEITKDDGEKVNGEILFTFEANGDNFILYSIGDEVFPSKLLDDGSLKTIEEDEWKLVERIFDEYLEDTDEHK